MTSSGAYDSNLLEENVLDNSFYHAFTTYSRFNNWLQIDFGEELANIGLVEVSKRYILHTRFKDVEVRIGNVPTLPAFGLAPIVVNSLCAAYPGANWSPKARFSCLTPMSGRYLTIQSLASTYLGIGEVHVNYVTGKQTAALCFWSNCPVSPFGLHR